MNGKVMLKGVPYFSDTQVIELTRAEYDALPASKYTDGILYCIKDDGIVEGDKYAPVIYSLEEREIGVWIDGKPLYQKTIVLPISDFSTTTDSYVLHGIDNIDFPVYAYGFPYGENLNHGQQIVPASATLSNTGINAQWSTTVTYFGRTKLGYFLGSQMLSRLSHFYFTLQYTKTTDVPGSGQWGTNGVPMVHYDGNEKIIGTWFGETLYEKTFIVTSFTYEDWINAVDITSLNIDKCLKISGYVKRSDASGLYMSYNGSYYENTTYNFIVRNYDKKIQYIINGYRDFSEMSITIQYTKTS